MQEFHAAAKFPETVLQGDRIYSNAASWHADFLDTQYIEPVFDFSAAPLDNDCNSSIAFGTVAGETLLASCPNVRKTGTMAYEHSRNRSKIVLNSTQLYHRHYKKIDVFC